MAPLQERLGALAQKAGQLLLAFSSVLDGAAEGTLWGPLWMQLKCPEAIRGGGHICLWVGCPAAHICLPMERIERALLGKPVFYLGSSLSDEHPFPRTFVLCEYSTMENISVNDGHRRTLSEGC